MNIPEHQKFWHKVFWVIIIFELFFVPFSLIREHRRFELEMDETIANISELLADYVSEMNVCHRREELLFELRLKRTDDREYSPMNIDSFILPHI